MRTTLTLDDDVAAQLERLRKAHRAGMKEIVNEALRVGFKQLARGPTKGTPYRTTEADLGRCLLGDVDSAADVLAVAEGESYR